MVSIDRMCPSYFQWLWLLQKLTPTKPSSNKLIAISYILIPFIPQTKSIYKDLNNCSLSVVKSSIWFCYWGLHDKSARRSQLTLMKKCFPFHKIYYSQGHFTLLPEKNLVQYRTYSFKLDEKSNALSHWTLQLLHYIII